MRVGRGRRSWGQTSVTAQEEDAGAAARPFGNRGRNADADGTSVPRARRGRGHGPAVRAAAGAAVPRRTPRSGGTDDSGRGGTRAPPREQRRRAGHGRGRADAGGFGGHGGAVRRTQIHGILLDAGRPVMGLNPAGAGSVAVLARRPRGAGKAGPGRPLYRRNRWRAARPTPRRGAPTGPTTRSGRGRKGSGQDSARRRAAARLSHTTRGSTTCISASTARVAVSVSRATGAAIVASARTVPVTCTMRR